MSSLRSHRSSSDLDLIQWNSQNSILKACISETTEVELELRRRGGRLAKRNGKLLTSQNELIGPLRSVSFSAFDMELVRGEPSLRRQWIDSVILQLEPVYYDLIKRYGRLIRQRSNIWKKITFKSKSERDFLLDAFDEQMALVSTRIHKRRHRALQKLEPISQYWQRYLSGGLEDVHLKYKPGSFIEVENTEDTVRFSIEDQLRQQRFQEEKIGQCKVGPHRDEIIFSMNETPLRRFGSSGQQRTLVLALKLSELELLNSIFGEPPLLLLDDVLAELDPKRQQLLLEAIGTTHQCLVSATHLESFDGAWKNESQILEPKSLSS